MDHMCPCIRNNGVACIPWSCTALQVIKLSGKAKTTVVDHVNRMEYNLFTETRSAPLRRWKEIGALGNAAVKASLIHASNVDAILAHFKAPPAVVSSFLEARRTSMPPPCRHRAGAAARDHLINRYWRGSGGVAGKVVADSITHPVG